MKRVVILGRGASGKSTLARRLGDITGLPVIELDKVFWRPGLAATPRDQWVVVQERLVAEEGGFLVGILGPLALPEVGFERGTRSIFLNFYFFPLLWQQFLHLAKPRAFWVCLY